MATQLSESNWAFLPQDILFTILDSTRSVYDHARFKVICKHWNYASNNYNKHQLMESWSSQLPMLMIPSNKGRKSERSLFNVVTGRSCDFQLSLRYNRRCCGYSYGWLATLGRKMMMTLTNPFLDHCHDIKLPRFIKQVNLGNITSEDPWNFENVVHQVKLSRDPFMYPESYQVAAIGRNISQNHGNSNLAILNAGCESWIFLDEEIRFSCTHDCMYNNDKFLVVDVDGKLISIDTNNSNLEVEIMVLGKSYGKEITEVYLAKSSQGSLIFIRRTMNYEDGTTTNFNVYKLTESKENYPKYFWDEIEDLGDDSLFVGDGHTFCVEASKFSSCLPNSIYYTPHFWSAGVVKKSTHDIGVFNMKNRDFKSIYPFLTSLIDFQPAVWLVPMLR